LEFEPLFVALKVEEKVHKEGAPLEKIIWSVPPAPVPLLAEVTAAEKVAVEFCPLATFI
jgi:hypothetical protein